MPGSAAGKESKRANASEQKKKSNICQLLWFFFIEYLV